MNVQNNIYRVGRFTQLSRKVLSKADGLCSDRILSLCEYNGELYIGTDQGLCRYNKNEIEPVFLSQKTPAVFALAKNTDGSLLIGANDILYEWKNGVVQNKIELSSPIVSIQTDKDNTLWVLTQTVLYRQCPGEKAFDLKIGVPGTGTCLAVSNNNTAFVGTKENGLNALTGKRWHWSELRTECSGILSDAVYCAEIDAFHNVWVGTDKGVCVYDDKGFWLTPELIPNLPAVPVNAMRTDQKGRRFFAAKTGLILLENGKNYYYSYKRWLPHPNATCIVITQNGFCVGTESGLSVFFEQEMTLEEKARYLRNVTETYNIRHEGFVLDRQLKHEGVVSLTEGEVMPTDNDGHNTGAYLSALCFEYACTKDQTVKKAADRSLKAMFRLLEVTGIPGFPARAIRYPGDSDYKTGNRSEWHIVTDENGKELEWLGETSSDEIVGHMFAYANFYDLAADESQKQQIQKAVTDILEHILTNGYHLVDTDGLPTTWANWDPDLLNHNNKWWGERGTNSLQMLTFLKIGFHITKNQKYEKLFESLAADQCFAMNLMRYKQPDGNLLHIDDNHDFLMIYLLMKYTDDPVLNSVFAMGLTSHYNDERIEHNAFFQFVYGFLTKKAFDVENCIYELTDYPLDQVSWTLYNSHRTDIKWNLQPLSLGLIPQLVEPLTPHERRIVSWDCNRFICDSGIQGKAEELYKKSSDPSAFTMFPPTGCDKGMVLKTCTPFTLAYWFGRYHRLFEEAESTNKRSL